MCIDGGYKTITPIEISNVLSAMQRGDINTRELRVYLACLAITSIREAANRARSGRKPRQVESVRFRICELCKLTGLCERVVKGALKKLERNGVLTFSENAITFAKTAQAESEDVLDRLAGRRSAKRPIPVPRRLLRHLAKSKKKSVIATALVYSARGLTISRSGEVRGAGAVKASWIAEVTGLSIRAVKSARKELIAVGFVTKDSASFQRKLNRDGAYFTINLSWKSSTERLLRSVAGAESDESLVTGDKIAPPAMKTDTVLAPPYKDKKTSSYEESKNQKTQLHALKPSGVFERGRGRLRQVSSPTLKNILIQDLRSISAVDALYIQAVKAGWIRHSEANRLNWFGAAVRAITTETKDPVRVFVSIVRRKAWYLITNAHDERARRGIARQTIRSEGAVALHFRGPYTSIDAEMV